MTILNINLTSATVQWVVDIIDGPQSYHVQFGTDETNMNNTISLGSIINSDGVAQQIYQVTLINLDQGTTYYVQVISTFENYTLTSDIVSFTTLEPGTQTII